MTYLAWKLLHITAVILFLGNITTGLFWAAHAHKSRDFGMIAATFSGIIRSDRWFTLPGVVGILVAGFATAFEANLSVFETGWIFWSLVLFGISGLVFGIRVAPLQAQILRLTRSAEKEDGDWASYASLYKRWERWGLLALLTPVAALVLMVLKPAL